jgi:integrase
MGGKRKSSRSLTGSRIYLRRGSYQYFSPEPILNPATNKVTKWHILCPANQGELAARNALNLLLGRVGERTGKGDFSIWFSKFETLEIDHRNKKTPADRARARIWEEGTKAVRAVFGVIKEAFGDFDVGTIEPVDVAQFLDQWEGRRAAQLYRGHLVKFFAWCARKGIAKTNPAEVVKVSKPRNRTVYITDKQYLLIQEGLRTGSDGRPTRTGEMVCCYMDLLYLLYQRGTDIRLLKWSDVQGDVLRVKPTKTEDSSGSQVAITLTPAVLAVLKHARALKKERSVYVIATEHGEPYTANGIGSLFRRACRRAGVSGVTLKDIRAKAATDATRAGFSLEQLRIALAHTDTSTTRQYIRSREIPLSEVSLQLPPNKETK